MAWDSSRPVPWTRLIRDWLLYVGVMVVVLLIVSRDRLSPGIFAGLFVSGPVFVLFGAALAKLGYQRKTLKDLRAETAARTTEQAAERAASGRGGATSPSRPRPAPTKRTSGGGNRPSHRKKR